MATPAAELALPYPGDDPLSVDILVEAIRAGRGHLSRLVDGITGARGSLHEAWRGADADAADREIGALDAVGALLVERLDAAATAVDSHHGDLLRVRVAIAALRDEWESARARLDTLTRPELFTPLWQPSPQPSSAGSSGGFDIFGQPMLTAADKQRQLEHEIMTCDTTLGAVQARWRALVEEQEASAAICRSTLNDASQGEWGYQVGVGATRGDLAAAIGLDALHFDDRERAREAAWVLPGDGWDDLTGDEQAFYRSLANSAFTAPLVLGSKAMIPQLWSGLEQMARQALIHDRPAEIGNTDGLPAAARDQANRISLTTFMENANRDATAAGTALPGNSQNPDDDTRKAQIEAALTAAGYSDEQILAVRGAMEVNYQLSARIPGHEHLVTQPAIDLLIFDPTAFGGQGRAAIAIGDVAAARNVAMLVPGMTSQVPGYLANQTGDALNLYQRANTVGESTAVVAYVGYRAPGMDLGVAAQDYSDAGATVVAADIAGLRAMAERDDARLTVIAHSYGSTTTSTAFAVDGARADNLVLIGSPGAGRAEHAAALTGVPSGHVFVGSASSDPVTTIVQQAQDPDQAALAGLSTGWHFGSEVGEHGPNTNIAIGAVAGLGGAAVAGRGQQALQPFLGVDPAGGTFGAVRLHAETQNDSVYEFGNHSDYYLPGSESLTNLANVTTGRDDQLGIAAPRPEDGGHYQGIDPEVDHVPPEP